MAARGTRGRRRRTVASTALVTLTSVVLSLTLVAVQLAMGQFSPRIVRSILQDRRSQFAIGLFTGTFALSVTVLREVNGKSSAGGPVPGLATVVDYALILSAIVTLVLYVHHTAQSIRVGGLIGLVGGETRGEIKLLYEAGVGPGVCFVGGGETVRRTGGEVFGQPGPLVADVQLGRSVTGIGLDPYRPWPCRRALSTRS